MPPPAVGGILIVLYALRAAGDPRRPRRTTSCRREGIARAARRNGLVFVGLLRCRCRSCLRWASPAWSGSVLGGYPLEMLASSLIGASQNWVLLAIPTFIFAGTVMERCGMSTALVDLARALVGWLRGGLGMSVIVVSYFFSDICGSKMAEVSALGSTLMPPLKRAGYRAEDGASLIAAGTAMGMLVPPAIFMIVIGEVTNRRSSRCFSPGSSRRR